MQNDLMEVAADDGVKNNTNGDVFDTIPSIMGSLVNLPSNLDGRSVSILNTLILRTYKTKISYEYSYKTIKGSYEIKNAIFVTFLNHKKNCKSEM